MNSPLDRDILINRFIDIETNTPLKKERFRKLDELYLEITTENKLTSQEILGLTKELLKRGVTIRQRFFTDAIHLLLSLQIEQGNVEAIKLMVMLEQQLIAYQGITKDYRYTVVELINKGLQFAPDDQELLQAYEKKTASYLSYSIHEVPIGIIYGNDGATIEECDELLEFVNEYEGVCRRLGIDRSELIEDCKYFYPLYREYLKVHSDYHGFEDYLVKHKHRTT